MRQTLPMSAFQVPSVTESAEAAPSGALNADLQKLSAETAAEPMSAADIRR